MVKSIKEFQLVRDIEIQLDSPRQPGPDAYSHTRPEVSVPSQALEAFPRPDSSGSQNPHPKEQLLEYAEEPLSFVPLDVLPQDKEVVTANVDKV
jgi:hypothetical protein